MAKQNGSKCLSLIRRARWLVRQQAVVAEVINTLRLSLETLNVATEAVVYKEELSRCKEVDFDTEDDCLMVNAWQRIVFQAIFKDEVATKMFPVSKCYLTKIAKRLANLLEDEVSNILTVRQDYELCEELCELVSQSFAAETPESISKFSFVSYGWAQAEDNSVVCGVRIYTGGLKHVGFLPWEAGLIMAEYCLQNPHEFEKKRILELGSGVGLTAIALYSTNSASNIILTDCNDDGILENLRLNVERNRTLSQKPDDSKSRTEISVRKLDWENSEDFEDIQPVDICIVADCVYDPSLVPTLVGVVKHLLTKNQNSYALLASTERNRDTFNLFESELRKSGINICDISCVLPRTNIGSEMEIFDYSASYLIHRNFDHSRIRLFRASMGNMPSMVWQLENSSPVVKKDFERLFFERNLPVKLHGIRLEPSSVRWRDRYTGSIDFRQIVEDYGDSIAPVVGNACLSCGTKWSKENPRSSLKTETPDCLQTSVKDYFACWNEHGARTAGYLKDWHCFAETRMKETLPLYSVPAFFQDDWLNWYCENCETDSNIDSMAKSDYRFVYCGPAGTSTGLHHDVLKSYSWSVNVTGAKLWFLYMPDQAKLVEKVGDFPDEFKFQLVDWYSKTRGRNKDMGSSLRDVLRSAARCLPSEHAEVIRICNFLALQGPDEAIAVPSSWHHMVLNLDDTLSINHNWINRYCLPQVADYVIHERLLTQESILNCKELMPVEEWDDLCEKIMYLNIGVNLDEWVDLLVKRYMWTASKTLNKADEGTTVIRENCEEDLQAIRQAARQLAKHEAELGYCKSLERLQCILNDKD